MALNYHMETLNTGDICEGGKISIPSYQRGIVWKHKHKKEFLESVKKGDPIGVVLIYKENDGKFTLIDGLQRLSTIKAYMDNPLAFIDEKDKFINEDYIEQLVLAVYKSRQQNIPSESVLSKQKKAFKKKFLEYLKDNKMGKISTAWEQIANDLDYPKDNMSIFSIFEDFYVAFTESLKIDADVKIQAIVYDGPKENLPSVFQKLNTGSVSLTKYEVFASIWSKTLMIFDDEEILQHVISKYETLKNKSNFDVEVTEEDLRTKGLTLFEYCYSMSEILLDENKNKIYSFLFESGSEKKSTEPIGFDLLALCCGLPINKADQLCSKNYLMNASPSFLTDLKNAIVNSSTIVGSALKNWLFDFRNNNLKSDSLYQIYHLILSVFKKLYSLNLETNEIYKIENNETKNRLEKFKKYAFKHYLYDTITSYWQINRQVNDLKNNIENTNLLNKYIFDIHPNQFEAALNSFLKENKTKATGNTADNTSKLILNYYYKMKNRKSGINYFDSSIEYKGENTTLIFDIEHIVAKEKFDKPGLSDLPKSFIGNLCYLSIKDNRSKKTKTLYQYADERTAFKLDEKFIDFIDYPSREELFFINCDSNIFIENYNKLIDDRAKKIVKNFLELLSE